MSGGERPRGRWLLAGALLWLVVAVLIPLVGERLLLGVRGRPVATDVGRAALSGLFLMLTGGSAIVAALLASAGLLRRSGEPGPAAPPAPVPGHRGALLAALLVTAAVGGLLIHAAGRSFEYDEILEMRHEVKTPFLSGLRPRAFINHLSGTLLARAGLALFGDSERAARAGAVTISILGLAGAALAARRLAPGPLATVWPTVLLGMNGLVLAYTIQIRGYAPLMWGGLGVGALLALAVSSEGPPGRLRTVGLGACALLMAFAHFFGFLYLGVLTVGLHLYLWTGWGGLGPPVSPSERQRRRSELARAAALLTVILGGAFCFWAHDLPWLLFRSGAVRTAVGPPRASSALPRLLSQLPLLQPGTGLRAWGALPLAFVAGAAFVVAWKRIPALRLVALTAVLPVVLVVAASVVRPVHLFARYFAASVPLGVLVVAAGAGCLVDRLRRPALPTALVLVATAAGLWPGFAAFLWDDFGYREGVAAGVRWLARHGDTRSRFVLAAKDEVSDVLGYYLPPEKTIELGGVGPLVERQREGILDLVVALGAGRLPGWRRMRFEPFVAALPLPGTGSRQSPIVLLATQPAAVP